MGLIRPTPMYRRTIIPVESYLWKRAGVHSLAYFLLRVPAGGHLGNVYVVFSILFKLGSRRAGHGTTWYAVSYFARYCKGMHYRRSTGALALSLRASQRADHPSRALV